MAPGDIETNKAIEETIRRNIESVIAFSNETRQIVRGLEEKVSRMEDQLRSKENEVQQLRNMVAAMQAKVYAGGTT